jgi:uncharacterized protein
MVGHHGHFVWYELLTTDKAAARSFYADVVGWGAQDASTPSVNYSLFTAGTDPVAGLMELPGDARKMGATSRWVGYVGVNDVDATADRIRPLGGAVYVQPTDTNIGRIAVVADPQTASLALVKALKPGKQQPAEPGRPGHVGWHELLTVDWQNALAFYGELFGWQRADAEIDPSDGYQMFYCGEKRIGGMFNKPAVIPDPFWVYYFNIGDIDEAMERVKAGGGQIFRGPQELREGSWIARCGDPQGAVFALEGKRSKDAVGRTSGSEVGWSTEWGGYSSRGRLVKPSP